MAKAPDPRRIAAERRRDAVRASRIVIHVNDDEYPIRPTELTPQIVGELRRTTGYTFVSLMLDIHQGFDLDVAQAAVWLSRRAAGEVLALEDVRVTWDDVIWAGEIDTTPEVDADDPPVSGGD